MLLPGEADHAAQRVVRKIDEEAMLAFQRDLVDEPAREVVPIDAALADRHQLDADAPQGRNPFADLDGVEAAEPIFTP